MALSHMSMTVALSCLIALLAAETAAAAAAHRAPAAFAPAPSPARDLAERLDGEGSQLCWEALVEIKSCTGEIILFLLNGEAYLGPGCCRAIRVIEGSCWAADAMLSAIGFTPEEGDMLKGYCDAGDEVVGATPPAAPRGAVANGGVASVARARGVGSATGRKSSAHR